MYVAAGVVVLVVTVMVLTMFKLVGLSINYRSINDPINTEEDS